MAVGSVYGNGKLEETGFLRAFAQLPGEGQNPFYTVSLQIQFEARGGPLALSIGVHLY